MPWTAPHHRCSLTAAEMEERHGRGGHGGMDIAKSVFQVHEVDAEGQVAVQRRLTRARLIPFFEKLPRCRVGIEACATAHYWARQLGELGHEVKSCRHRT